MNDLQIFKSNEFGEIRTFAEQDGSITFCGTDVATALGYKDTVNALKQHCKTYGVVFHHIIDSMGRTQQAKFISEGNLYRLIAGSHLPEAEKFESWIFDEVIPSIRKHGAYSVKPMSQAEIIAAQAQLLVDIEKKSNIALETANRANVRLTNALDVFTKPTADDWQQNMCQRIRKICIENQLSYLQFFGNLYREVDRTAHVDIKSRQSRKKARLKATGAKTSEIKAVSELSIIDADPQLRLIFDGLVRKYEAKYAANRIFEKEA